MPAEEVFQYVKGKLKAQQPTEARSQKPKKVRTPTKDAAGGLGSLGKMKGRYAQVLADFWSGQLQVPDTLNIGIRLLALPLPYYRNEEEAVALVESYVDELPDCSFSDRLTAGNRSEVSRIIRSTVHQVYDGNGGQPDPELSTQKLKATVAAWQRRGFDPTDKATWGKALSSGTVSLAKDFCWRPEEVLKLGHIQDLLKTSLQTASDAMKHLLRLVKGHTGEIAVAFVQRLLEGFGINCGHHGKVNKLLALLRHWDWIRVTAWERWHQRGVGGQALKGRARTYAIGEALRHKFEDGTGSSGSSRKGVAHQAGAAGQGLLFLLPGGEKKRNLCFTSHRSLVLPSAAEGGRSDEEVILANQAPGGALPTEMGVERNKGSP
jgi:hypothetical protein